MFTIFYCFSAHFQVSKNHKLIIIVSWLIVVGWKIKKCLDLGFSPSNHGNVFLSIFPGLYLLPEQVSWPNDVQSHKRTSLPSCANTYRIITTFDGIVPYINNWISQNGTWLSMK